MMINEHFFEQESELLESLSKSIINSLQLGIDEKNRATLALSGGNTPKALLKKLSMIDFSWELITVTLCDERCVNNNSKDSNEFLIKEHFLQNFASKANFIPLFRDNSTIENISNNIKPYYPFDVIVLGMGEDAHTASLFPNNPKLNLALDLELEDLYIKILPTTAPYERISLTRSAILSCENIYLHIEGEKKLEVYNRAKNCDDIYKMPISSILNQNLKAIEVYFR